MRSGAPKSQHKDVPKWNGDVESLLKPLYPKVKEVLKPVNQKAALPNVTARGWNAAIKNSTRGTTPAASGKRLDHYIQCNVDPTNDDEDELSDSDPWHYRRQLCVLQAAGQFDWGEHNDEMYESVFATTITVLEKNPGQPGIQKPRPIGSGSSPDRKLGNVCLVRASYADMKKCYGECAESVSWS